jgi:hypothetical protein
MGLGDILSKSISYPFSDLTKFLIVGLIFVISDMDGIFYGLFGPNSFMAIIGIIIAIVFSVILSGYSIDVIKRGIDNSNEIPDFDFANNFVDGLKLILIGFVYFIIPLIITLVLLFVFGAIGSGLNQVVGSLGIWALIAVIIFIIFGIFAIVAQARFAISHSISDALSIGEVFEDVKRIGILKIILFLIVVSILISVLALILAIITVIPVIGVMIIDLLLGGFIFLFLNYGIGLLYAE